MPSSKRFQVTGNICAPFRRIKIRSADYAGLSDGNIRFTPSRGIVSAMQGVWIDLLAALLLHCHLLTALFYTVSIAFFGGGRRVVCSGSKPAVHSRLYGKQPVCQYIWIYSVICADKSICIVLYRRCADVWLPFIRYRRPAVSDGSGRCRRERPAVLSDSGRLRIFCVQISESCGVHESRKPIWRVSEF